MTDPRVEKRVQLSLRSSDGSWVDLNVDGDRAVTMAWGDGGTPAKLGDLRELIQQLFDLGFAMGRDYERNNGSSRSER